MGNNIRTSKLPGQEIALDSGDVCDTEGHQNIAAVKRIVGETDSMGSESICFCQPCWDAYKDEPKEPLTGVCDWCQTDSAKLRNMRDFEEGAAGPVYQVCDECARKHNDALDELQDSVDDDDSVTGDTRSIEDRENEMPLDEDNFDCDEPPVDSGGILVRLWTSDDGDHAA